MKKHYDKLFLLAAVLILAASSWYYLSSEDAAKTSKEKHDQTMAKSFGGEKWTEVQIDQLALNKVDWPEAKPQDEDGIWYFQIFTPPKIWVDADGFFSAEPPPSSNPLAGSLYGFKYSGIRNDPYSIHVKGYFIDPDGEVVVQFYDDARNMALKGKINEEIVYRKVDGKMAKAGVVVKKFDKKTVREEKGTIKQVISVTLMDEALGREIEIEYGKPTYLEESRAMLLVPDSRSWKDWEIKSVGDKFEADGGIVFTVKELDFENETILVEKQVPRTNNPNPQISLIKFSKNSSPTIIK